MSFGVAPDGSPVEVYTNLPPGDTPGLIDDAVPSGAILELGSGPGRLTRPLVDMGRAVLAVDESQVMLDHIDFTETLQADLFSIDLDRSFSGVVAASHLINVPEPDRRRRLLGVCSAHLLPSGVALIERYEPGWAADPQPGRSQVGNVEITFEPMEVNTSGFVGRVVYVVGERSYTQEFAATNMTTDMIATEARENGLHLVDWIDAKETWGRLRPA